MESVSTAPPNEAMTSAVRNPKADRARLTMNFIDSAPKAPVKVISPDWKAL